MTEDQKHQLDELEVTDMLNYLSARVFSMEDRIRRLKWHDLRKDPNDLPNNQRYVWTNVGAGYHDDDCWRDDFSRLQDVIAWCEPNFETDGDELKRFLALWENAVCEIRNEIKAQETPALVYAKDLCDKLEQSMVAYSYGNAEYAHFVI